MPHAASSDRANAGRRARRDRCSGGQAPGDQHNSCSGRRPPASRSAGSTRITSGRRRPWPSPPTARPWPPPALTPCSTSRTSARGRTSSPGATFVRLDSGAPVASLASSFRAAGVPAYSKADNDLTNAAHTLKLGKACPTDKVCFHAQRCVEKHIKALLVFRATPFPKTHNSRVLRALLPPKLRPKLVPDRLTRYATVLRYPGAGKDAPERSAQGCRDREASSQGGAKASAPGDPPPREKMKASRSARIFYGALRCHCSSAADGRRYSGSTAHWSSRSPAR
jgi:HEPN domain-containing protein